MKNLGGESIPLQLIPKSFRGRPDKFAKSGRKMTLAREAEARNAMSAIGSSVSDNNFLARAIRCSVTYAFGLIPIDCLNAREK